MNRFFPALFAFLSLVSCESLFSPFEGELTVNFSPAAYFGALTKGGTAVPDTNDFILKVTGPKGDTVYEGKYCDAPESMLVSEGKYTVSAYSREFNAPAFDTPQYGDTQTVSVTTGKNTSVLLMCHQTNCGVRLNISEDFLKAYPSSSLFLKSNEGKLMYSYSEKRFAFFKPGQLTLMMSTGTTDSELLTRSLSEQDMLMLNISVSGAASSGQNKNISIQLDTARNWLSEDYVIGGGSSAGSSKDKAMSVPEAKNHIGSENVWVYGYIVGGDLSSSKASFKAPFTSRTNIVIAAKASCTDKASCLSVQLQKGDIRDAINLVDHPDYLGRKVYLRGSIVSAYYGIPGLQDLTEFAF